MDINEIKLKLSGSANISEQLELGNEYSLTISNAECREVREVPNDDGTVNRIYNLKLSEMSEVNIISGQKVIQSKKKGSQSQKLRMAIYQVWLDEYQASIEFDKYYEKQMSDLIKQIQSEAFIGDRLA